MNIKNRNLRPKRAFTLIETLVAVSIVTFAVAGPLYSAYRSLVATELARDRLTASYLAQEGIEYVRMVRDNKYLAAYNAGDTDTAWDDFLDSIPCTSAVSCTLDPVLPLGTGLQECPSTGCTPLYLRDNNGTSNVYTQNSDFGSPVTHVGTSFIRSIYRLNAPALPSNERIVSRVRWNFHNKWYSVVINDHLTPWQ